MKEHPALMSARSRVLGFFGAMAVVVLLSCAAVVLVVSQSGASKAGGSRTAPAEKKLSSQDAARVQETRIDPMDSEHPAVKHLEPKLRAAIQSAAQASADAGREDFWMTSGWRNAAYQQQLLDNAVTKHGSLAAARRWVNTPESSEHVAGNAADIGPATAAAWLGRHAAEFGLCRTYANEAWHFELKPEGQDACPAQRRDASTE